jgi:replication-associated recombination protein RarA
LSTVEDGSEMSESQDNKADIKQNSVTKKPGTYEYDQVVSALQKEIRRGKLEDALFWAIMLEKMNHTVLWNRLVIIGSEDIGPASQWIPMQIDILKKNYFQAVDRHDSAQRLFLTHAIFTLVNSPKSRIIDDLCNAMYGEIEFEFDSKFKNKLIPEYAKDMHTDEGKANSKSWLDFYNEGAKITKETSIFKNEWNDRAKKIHLNHGKISDNEALYAKWDKRKDSLRKEKIRQQKKDEEGINNPKKKSQPETEKKDKGPLDQFAKV